MIEHTGEKLKIMCVDSGSKKKKKKRKRTEIEDLDFCPATPNAELTGRISGMARILSDVL